jgi:hypothetical protein
MCTLGVSGAFKMIVTKLKGERLMSGRDLIPLDRFSSTSVRKTFTKICRVIPIFRCTVSILKLDSRKFINGFPHISHKPFHR